MGKKALGRKENVNAERFDCIVPSPRRAIFPPLVDQEAIDDQYRLNPIVAARLWLAGILARFASKHSVWESGDSDAGGR